MPTMGLPQVTEARLFYRAAKQRYDDAQLLLDARRTTGAVYLAGYTVECFLKALVLVTLAAGARKTLLREFRGSRAHDIEWLGALYRQQPGVSMPREIARHLARVASWSTELPYATGLLKKRDADEFMESVVALSKWADGKM
jgi:HEPN domain-containing protein